MDRTNYYAGSHGNEYGKTSRRTPQYHYLRATGGRLPNNEFHEYALKWSAFDDFGEAQGMQVNPYHWCTDGYFQYGPDRLTLSTRAEALSMARNKLLSKLRNTDLDIGVMLGEYRETAALITDAMNRVRRSLKHVRQGNATQAYRALVGGKMGRLSDIPRFGSNSYLAYQYGVRPLIQDVMSAAELLRKRYDAPPPYQTLRARHIEPISGVLVQRDAMYDGKLVYTNTHTVSGYYIATAGLRYRVTNPLLRRLDTLGLVNPFSVAWELTRLSFVLDWFLPIGDWLANVVPPQGVEFVDGWSAVRVVAEATKDIHSTGYVTDSGYVIATPHHYGGKTLLEEKRREPLGSFPSYQFNVPDISLERGQILSGMALLTQAFMGKR